MSKPTLYYMVESPPSRTVLAVSRIIGLDLELKRVDLSKKEQFNPEYLQINPFHVVPTLVDTDGFTLWESRAIATYLIQKYKPDSYLYPSGDLQKRATIDRFMHYDLGAFYRAISDVVYNIFTSGVPSLDKLPNLNTLLQTLDNYIGTHNGGGKFLSGNDQLSVADLSMYFGFKMTEIVPEIDTAVFANIHQWRKMVEQALKPYNQDGIFDKAHENMKMFAETLKQQALSSSKDK